MSTKRERYTLYFTGCSKNVAQNSRTLDPIWLPHWPACKWTISRIATDHNKKDKDEHANSRVKCPRSLMTSCQVYQHGPRNVLAPRGLVVVHVNPLQLQVRVAIVLAIGLNAMFVRDHLPELRMSTKRERYTLYFTGCSKNVAQNSRTLDPIWLPHWPACKWTISRIATDHNKKDKDEHVRVKCPRSLMTSCN